MRRPSDATLARLAAFAITAIYAVLGLVIFAPEGLYSGDVGVKYVQARALAASGFRSLDVPYPGAFLDPEREFFPLRPPFVMPVGNETQTIFSPAVALLEAGPAALADIRGMTGVSLIAALAILLGTAWFAPEGLKTAAVFAVGAASPLWAYAVLGLDHAPAIAFSTAAFALALRG